MITDIYKYVIRSPLIKLRSNDPGDEIYLKLENLQPFGSYKLRGIANIVLKEPPEKLKAGLVAASAGNMGQAVGYMASLQNIPCTIVVPDNAPVVKLKAIEALGAKLVKRPFSEVWDVVVQNRVEGIDGYFVHPANNPLLTEGYESIAVEILEELPDVNRVVIPFGAGGLTIGIASRLKREKPDTEVMTVEPVTACPLHLSKKEGKPVRTTREKSFVDGIGAPEVLPEVFERVAPIVDNALAVGLDEIKDAIRLLFGRHKVIAEGAGAAPVAASLSGEKAGKTVCIISGGNIDSNVLFDIIS